MSVIVYRSAVASLVAQVLVGAVTLAGFFVPVSKDTRDDLRVILALELVSQVVEFAWYVTAVCYVRRIATWARYVDWVVSTPIMLVSTALFFRHRRGVALLPDALQDGALWATLALNWAMLAFGYALETRAVSQEAKFAGLALGGASFVGSFGVLSTMLDEDDAVSVGLFWAMYGVWALYGVAAAMADVPKNVAYNALDVVSKNFYGLFLFVYAIVS